jgi:uncharacterized protein (DUF433 family)
MRIVKIPISTFHLPDAVSPLRHCAARAAGEDQHGLSVYAPPGAEYLPPEHPGLALHPGQLCTYLLDDDSHDIIGFTMNYQERITITPGKRSGKPCIRDTRITVYDILEYLASGMSEKQVMSDFPELEKEDIRAALLFAADRERKLTTTGA